MQGIAGFPYPPRTGTSRSNVLLQIRMLSPTLRCVQSFSFTPALRGSRDHQERPFDHRVAELGTPANLQGNIAKLAEHTLQPSGRPCLQRGARGLRKAEMHGLSFHDIIERGTGFHRKPEQME